MSSSSGRPRGVICDDRPLMRRTVTGLLVGSGFSVAGEASGCAELAELLGRERPQVAVVSLPLAGRHGLQAVGALHAAAPGCAVVLLSAFSSSGLQRAAVDAGAWAVVAEEDPRALRGVLLGLARTIVERQLDPARGPDRQDEREGLAAGELTAHGASQGARNRQAQA